MQKALKNAFYSTVDPVHKGRAVDVSYQETAHNIILHCLNEVQKLHYINNFKNCVSRSTKMNCNHHVGFACGNDMLTKLFMDAMAGVNSLLFTEHFFD